jgi:hypothetical protein
MDVIHTLIDMVYTLLLFYVQLYENNTLDKCSSQFVLFSLTNLVNSVLSTLLVDLAYAHSLEDNRL